MENSARPKGVPILVISYWLLVNLLTGCVTVPTREGLPTYNLSGATHFPLIAYCQQNGIGWDYDIFSRTVVLTKDLQKIKLRVGESLILVNGMPKYLEYPVDIYKGTVVVPYRFKELFPLKDGVVVLPKLKKVVIDAGHGGKDPGTIGRSGLKEKDVNLDIAKRLGNLLRADGVEVVMTRSTDKFIPLSQRVEVANTSGTGVFISIHGNANRVSSLKGFEIYYVSPTVSDTKRALSAAQNSTLNLDKDSLLGDAVDLKVTLWDMIYTHNRADSITLAQSISKSLKNNLDARILGIKESRFYILKGSQIPAILIEVGFLTNASEEQSLKNGYYRQRIAEEIKQGIDNYVQGLVRFKE